MKKPKKQKKAESAHDDREINAWGIGRFALLVLALTGVAMAIMWAFDRWMEKGIEAHRPPPLPMASDRPTAPPDPKLQRTPQSGLAALRAEEQAQLESYKWIDRKNGVVQIPIDRAIELLARRGLPARRQGPPVESPHSAPTESSLGIKKKKEQKE
jgi:hypothetical protein